MEELDDFIRNNKDDFDKVSPKEIDWSNKIKRTKKTFNSWKVVLKIAAVFVCISSVVLLNSKDDNQLFSNLIMESPEGDFIKLEPSDNKYTLVQFWESGNVVCSDDNCYYYIPAYEKYKELGFEIYAISLDKNQNEWVSGIQENNLPWIHVSDLKGWESPICIECNISKVPTSFLLNHKGEVIETDLDADKLERTLERLLIID